MRVKRMAYLPPSGTGHAGGGKRVYATSFNLWRFKLLFTEKTLSLLMRV